MDSQQNSSRLSKFCQSSETIKRETKKNRNQNRRSIPQTPSVKPFKKEREETETLREAPVVSSPEETWTWVTG